MLKDLSHSDWLYMLHTLEMQLILMLHHNSYSDLSSTSYRHLWLPHWYLKRFTTQWLTSHATHFRNQVYSTNAHVTLQWHHTGDHSSLSSHSDWLYMLHTLEIDWLQLILMLQSNNTILKINHSSSTLIQHTIAIIIMPIHRLPYWYIIFNATNIDRLA